MKTFLINLDQEQERLSFADAQLKRLSVDYERISAVYGMALRQEERDNAVNRFRWWCAVGRPCRLGEIGCALSHYSIYKRLSQSDETASACVLEDDVVLDSRFKDVLDYVGENIDSKRPQVVLLSNHCKGHSGSKSSCAQEFPRIERCCSDMYTEGYVITPVAAAALLNVNMPMQCPCDWWGRWAKRGIIELYHAFPTVCSQKQGQFESGISGIGAFDVHNLSFFKYVIHKLKRINGKIVDFVLPL